MRINETSYTVFDVETTGLFPYNGDRICEIGAVRIEPDGTQNVFESLVDPCRSISPGAFAVNRITADMLEGQPTIDKVLPKFLKFIEGSVLVAYNAGFDMGFIESALGDNKKRLEGFIVIDVLKLARSLFPEIGRYKLSVVADSLGFSSEGKHRALADAVMTLKILKKEIEMMNEKGITTIEDIAETPRVARPGGTEKDSQVRQIIQDAIHSQNAVNITYQSVWGDKLTSRKITPKSMREGYDRSYVIAYCHLRKEDRKFRLDCIVTAEVS